MPKSTSSKAKLQSLRRQRAAMARMRDKKATRIVKLQAEAEKHARLARNLAEHRESDLGSWRNMNQIIDRLDAEIAGLS